MEVVGESNGLTEEDHQQQREAWGVRAELFSKRTVDRETVVGAAVAAVSARRRTRICGRREPGETETVTGGTDSRRRSV